MGIKSELLKKDLPMIDSCLVILDSSSMQHWAKKLLLWAYSQFSMYGIGKQDLKATLMRRILSLLCVKHMI